MNVRRELPHLVLVLGLACGACSSSSSSSGGPADAQPDSPVGDDTLPDASPDTSVDAPADRQVADGGDAGVPAWRSDSTGFQLVESGGGLVPPVDVYLCTGETRTWRYDVATRTLDLTGCSQGQPLSGHAVLSAQAAATLTDLLGTLTVKGPGSSCGADAPDLALSVFGPGAATTQYLSDFYSGCASFDAGSSAFIAFGALEQIVSLVYGDLQACADGGSPAEAGVDCTPAAIDDGGPPDAASDGG